jgi:hypothetical protein
MFGGEVIEVAEIDRDAKFRAAALNGEGERIDGIVGNGERIEAELTDLEGFPATNLVSSWDVGGALAEIAGYKGSSRDVSGDLEGAGNGTESAGVIAVLVSDDYGGESGGILADFAHSPGKFARAEPTVDQNTRFA